MNNKRVNSDGFIRQLVKLTNLSIKIGSFIFCLLILSGCQNGKTATWDTKRFDAASDSFAFSTLKSPVSATRRNMQFVIVRDQKGERYYLEGYPYIFPSSSQNRMSKVSVTYPTGEENIFAVCLKGGHRLLVPKTDGYKIVSCLSAGHQVTIKIGKYFEILYPYQFQQSYRSL